MEKRTEAYSWAGSRNHWTWEAELRKRDGLWLGLTVFLGRWTEDRFQGSGTLTGKEEAPDRERTAGDSPAKKTFVSLLVQILGFQAHS